MPRRNKRLNAEQIQEKRDRRGRKVLGEVRYTERRSMEHGLEITSVKVVK